MADEECRKQETGSRAVPVKQTVFTCRVLLPNHYFSNALNNQEKTYYESVFRKHH